MSTRQGGLVVSGLWALLVVVAIHLFDFPGSVPEFRTTSNGGTLLDAIPAFTADALYQRVDAYGVDGRANYAFRNTTTDVILPLSVVPFLFLLARAAAGAAALQPRWRASLGAIPLVYVLFDLMENGAVLTLLANYPERMNRLAGTLWVVTLIKRAASLLALTLPSLVLAVGVLHRKHRRTRTQHIPQIPGRRGTDVRRR